MMIDRQIGSKIKENKITWTLPELQGLLEDEESRVRFERTQRHLALHPFHLNDLNAAIREILGSSLNSYDSKFEGIILSYKNPKLISGFGTILYDSCYVHIDIEADFYVFNPVVGDTLRGIVNKKSQDHVSILVHKAFNVSVPRRDQDDDWPGHLVEIGQEVRFTITYLDLAGRLPYMRASMHAQDYLHGCKISETELEGEDDSNVTPKNVKLRFYDDDDSDDDDEELVSKKAAAKLEKSNKNKGNYKAEIETVKHIKVEISSSENESDTNRGNQGKKLKNRFPSDSSDVDDTVENLIPSKKVKVKKEKHDKKVKNKRTKNKLDVILQSESESDTAPNRRNKRTNKSFIDDSDDDQNIVAHSPLKANRLRDKSSDEEVKIITKQTKRDSNETNAKRSKKAKYSATQENSDEEVPRKMSPHKSKKSSKEYSNQQESNIKSKKIKIKEEVLSSDSEFDVSIVTHSKKMKNTYLDDS